MASHIGYPITSKTCEWTCVLYIPILRVGCLCLIHPYPARWLFMPYISLSRALGTYAYTCLSHALAIHAYICSSRALAIWVLYILFSLLLSSSLSHTPPYIFSLTYPITHLLSGYSITHLPLHLPFRISHTPPHILSFTYSIKHLLSGIFYHVYSLSHFAFAFAFSVLHFPFPLCICIFRFAFRISHFASRIKLHTYSGFHTLSCSFEFATCISNHITQV